MCLLGFFLVDSGFLVGLDFGRVLDCLDFFFKAFIKRIIVYINILANKVAQSSCQLSVYLVILIYLLCYRFLVVK